MTARYRLIQYQTDPFTDSRVTIGALVESGSQVRLARAQLIPGPNCLGTRQAWVNAQSILDALGSLESFDVPSADISALALLSEPRPVPESVANAVDWVQNAVLPRQGARAEDANDGAHRQRREALGYRFFEQWQVSQFVQRKFPADRVLGAVAPVSHRISHWVPGKKEVLLLEPILGNRLGLEEDLRIISESFLAHQRLFQLSGISRAPVCVAYVIPSGHAAAVSDAHAALRQSAAVLNVDDPPQRQKLLESITATARSAVDQGDLIS